MQVDPRAIDPAILARCAWTARICRVPFISIQSAYGIREDLALFKSRDGSTISLPLSKVNPLNLSWKLTESEQAFK